MAQILVIGIVLSSILLVLVVLIQNSKGGGISSNFTSANQIMGARRGSDVIEKTTWTLSIVLLICCVLAAPKTSGALDGADESITKQKATNAVAPQQAPIQQSAAPSGK